MSFPTDYSNTEALIDHPDIACSLYYVATAYDKVNNFQKALEYHLKALEMRQRIYGNVDHADTACSLLYVGCSYDKVNNSQRALEYHLKALEMRQRIYGNAT